MRITVDLASKFSAACVMDARHKVHREFDSLNKSSFEFVDEILAAVVEYDPEIIIVEDVPYGISSQQMTKAVTRLQGAIIRDLTKMGYWERLVFLNPSTWQKEYSGVARGPKEDREKAAAFHADFMGYQPPNLVQQHIDSLPEGARVLKKNTNPLEKTMTDYIDAFLMARWSYSLGSLGTHLETKGCQRALI